MSKKKKRSSRFGGRFALFVFILLVIVLFFAFSSLLRGGTLQRLFYQLTSGVSGSVDSPDVVFDSNDHNRFHLINNDLAVLSNESLTVYAMSGDAHYTVPLAYRNPTVAGNEKYMIAFDRGSSEFFVTNGNSTLLQTEAEASIINANINKNGAFSLITDGPDCKTMLSIYNPSMEVIYRLRASEQYVLDAAVANNNKDMAMLSLSASGDGFIGKISFYHLDEDTPYFTYELNNRVPLSVQYDADNRIRILCENQLLLFENDGTIRSEISFSQNELLSFSTDSDRIFGLLLNNYSTGGHSTLSLLPRNETEPLRINFNEETLSVSTAGNFIAVRYPDKIVVYNEKLQQDRVFEIPAGIKDCIMREDGTVLAIGSNFASLLIS